MIIEAAERIFQDLSDPQTINNAEDESWKEPLWSALEESGLTLTWVPDTLGGAGALGTGWYLSFTASRKMHPEYHAVPRSVAESAALRYNSKLRGEAPGAKVGVGYARKF